MFPSQRSVPYNDETLRAAIQQIKHFEADFGGTVIYEPLKQVFKKTRAEEVATSHVYLLTDGAIWDTQQVIDLIAQQCNIDQRVHTFGVGHGASEELIKQAAFKGFGHFSFIYDEEQIEEAVVKAVSKTHLDY